MELFEQKEADLINLIDKYHAESKKQLEAIQFIKEVMSSIKSYFDFQQYKNDMLEALNDIDQALLKTIREMSQIHHYREYNKQRSGNILYYDSNTNSNSNIGIIENSANPSLDINTTSLGLRFNYDSYLNKEKNVKAQEEQILFIHKQELQWKEKNQLKQQEQYVEKQKEQPLLNFDYSSTHSIDTISKFSKEKLESQATNEPIPLPISIEKTKMNESSIPYNMTFNSSANKKNNLIAYDQSNDQNDTIKYNNDNKNQQHIYISDHIDNNNSDLNEIIAQSKELIIEERSNENQNEIMVNDPIKNSTIIKQKASRLADLIMKINSEQEIYEIIIQLFGEDILDTLMSSKISDEFIDNVEKSVREIERLREKDLIEDPINSQGENNQNSQTKKTNNNEELFYETPINNYHPIPIQINSIDNNRNGSSIKEYNNKTNNKNKAKAKSFSDELLVSNGLISNYSFTAKDNSNLKKNSFNKQTMVSQYKIPKKEQYKKSANPLPPSSNFINYTSPHGYYFDSSLQNGGISKFKTFKSKSPNKAISPVREYIKSFHQLTSNSLNHRRIINS